MGCVVSDGLSRLNIVLETTLTTSPTRGQDSLRVLCRESNSYHRGKGPVVRHIG